MNKKVIIIATMMIAFIAYGIYWAFYDMNRLPKGDLISEQQSPNGTYTIKAYITNGGATTSFAIRGELNYNKIKKSPKNIYWNYRQDNATIEWVDDTTVIINGHKLNVINEKFDYRRN